MMELAVSVQLEVVDCKHGDGVGPFVFVLDADEDCVSVGSYPATEMFCDSLILYPWKLGGTLPRDKRGACAGA